MRQVHVVFRSGGLFSAAQQVVEVFEDQTDAWKRAAEAPLLYVQSFEVTPSSSRTADGPDARPEGAATAETTATSGSSTAQG